MFSSGCSVQQKNICKFSFSEIFTNIETYREADITSKFKIKKKK